jgi:hypothetical protein
VRETFVAVVTSNLPMISPLIARCFRPIIGSLRSLSSSGNKGSRTPRSKDIPLPPGYDLDDKNPRRGLGPRSVYPIPNFSVNCSDEQLYTRREEEEESGGAASYDPDLEAAQAMRSRAGVIVKQTSVEVIESRHAGSAADEREVVGDYYLVGQAQRDAERLARLPEAGAGKRTRTSPTFGIGRAV